MALGLTDPTTALSFSAMPVADLVRTHRDLLGARREVDHWRRLVTARIDLAVASVADMDDILVPPSVEDGGRECPPPAGLRDLLGIARLEERLREATLLTHLRHALEELARYGDRLDAVCDEAAGMLAARAGDGVDGGTVRAPV